MKLLINDHWVNHQDAKINLFNESIMFGLGIFETLRTYPGKKLLFLAQHIERLFEGCSRIYMPIQYSKEAIFSMVEKVVESSGHDIQRLKILAIPDHLIVISTPLETSRINTKGFKLKTIVRQRPVPEVKSTAYLDCYLAFKEAQLAGYDDALLLSSEGYVLEASRSNLVWLNENQWVSCRKGVLPGITLRVIESITTTIQHGLILPEQLIKLSDVYICNSIIGVVPVIAVDNIPINQGIAGEGIKNIIRLFDNLVDNL